MFKKSFGKLMLSALSFASSSIFLSGCSDKLSLLNSSGTVGEKESWLMVFVAGMVLIVVIPVIILAVVIPLKYREGNKKAKYEPEFVDSTKLEIIWWSIPIIIIFIIGVFTWKYTHDLDPRQKLASEKKPIRIDAISVQWKWIFLYPDEGIATVNHIEIPRDTPINFHITSNGVMNSLWIPDLGGQIYAMAGMETELNLDSKKIGTFIGKGANFTGGEFAKNTFTVDSVSRSDYDSWVRSAKLKSASMSNDTFMKLQVPGLSKEKIYNSYPSDLFDNVLYMNSSGMEKMDGMEKNSDNPLHPVGAESTEKTEH